MSIGYKKLRTTIVLALNSKTFESIEDKEVLAALSNAVAVNYDLSRLEKVDLERIYAYFDNDATSAVLDEFQFYWGLGNIRDNGECVAHCALCGKGDSRDDGANEDQIRFEFKLTNTAGGTDVWCGSTCIINHALKVEGAETSEQAQALLRKSFAQHKKEWEKEAWRAANPDHPDMRDFYKRNDTRVPRLARNWLWDRGNTGVHTSLDLMGINPSNLFYDAERIFGNPYGNGSRPMKTVVRFYERSGYLTPRKHSTWAQAKALVTRVDALADTLEKGLLIEDIDERIAFFKKAGEEARDEEPDAATEAA